MFQAAKELYRTRKYSEYTSRFYVRLLNFFFFFRVSHGFICSHFFIFYICLFVFFVSFFGEIVSFVCVDE